MTDALCYCGLKPHEFDKKGDPTSYRCPHCTATFKRNSNIHVAVEHIDECHQKEVSS